MVDATTQALKTLTFKTAVKTKGRPKAKSKSLSSPHPTATPSNHQGNTVEVQLKCHGNIAVNSHFIRSNTAAHLKISSIQQHKYGLLKIDLLK